MFERLTDRARRVIVLAQEEAKMLGHRYIGTEHLVLGILAEGENLAAQVLNRSGVTHASARDDVAGMIGRGTVWERSDLVFTSRLKNVLELSLREALRYEYNYLAPEHQLLGLIREGQGTGVIVIERYVAAENIKAAILEAMPRPARARESIGLARGLEVQEPMNAKMAISSCKNMLAMLATDQERRAVLAYLTAWFE